MTIYMLLVTLAVAAVFLLVFRFGKTRMAGGFFFLCTLLCAGITLALFALETLNPVLTMLLVILALVLSLVLLFGVYVLIALLLLNARAVWKREKHRLANALTLILGLGLVALLILSAVANTAHLPVWVRCAQAGFTAVLLYYFLHVSVFATSVFLCNMVHPAKNKQYVVVLGSGLVNGKVPPLLAGRINRAITFYTKQKAKTAPPKLVLSGGKGADEPVSEAQAMRAYALRKGIPAADILTEEAAANTKQNMEFSRRVMEADAGGLPYKAIFASSNYHLLRAGIYARKAGLRIDGIGSRTAAYYLPNALLREYIAFLRMYRRHNLIVAGLVFVLFTALAALAAWARQYVG